MAVLGSPSLIGLICSLWTWRKQHLKMKKPDISELRSCVKVVVAVPGSPSVTVLMVSVDVKQH